jgi:hypothetical protein
MVGAQLAFIEMAIEMILSSSFKAYYDFLVTNKEDSHPAEAIITSSNPSLRKT